MKKIITLTMIVFVVAVVAARAQNAVDLPAFNRENTLTLERYDGSRGTITTQILRDLSDKDDIWISRTPNAASAR